MVKNHIFTKNSLPQVTILVAAFNQEKYIGRCIRSLLAQNFPREDFEIIVVDDGSVDKTSYALDLFKDEISLISNKSNLGLPRSLNIAIKKIRSPFFVRVDADDFVSRNFLSFLYSFITQNSYMDAVSCDYNIVNDEGISVERKNCLDFPIACGIIFRTDQIVRLGMYDEDFLLHEERDLRIRFLKEHKIHRLELPLYRYRRHATNMTNNIDAMSHYMINLVNKHGDSCE